MKDVSKFAGKTRYSIDDLLEILAILRSPESCPWDREQNHKSIRRDFLEECYEAIEAIDTDNTALLQEELGDVLLQVVFHSEIERELGHFDFADVVSGIAEKMVVRHPHVFSDVQADTTDAVLKNWDQIKRETKRQKSNREVLESVSPAMPALMRAQKVRKKAAKMGGPCRKQRRSRRRLRPLSCRCRRKTAQSSSAARFSTLRRWRSSSAWTRSARFLTPAARILRISRRKNKAARIRRAGS